MANEKLEALKAGLAQGTTFNFGDELGAALMALFPYTGKQAGQTYGERYNEALNDTRGMVNRMQEQSPAMSIAGNIVGAIPATVATAPYTAAASSFPSFLARNALVGSGEGALMGAGAGENTQGRALEALKGGTTGAIFGAAVPAAFKGAGSALGMFGEKVVSPVLERLGKSPEKFARKALTNAALAEGATPEELLARIQASEVPLIPADVAQYNGPIQRLSRAAVTEPNVASGEVGQQLMNRQLNRGQRLVNSLSKYISPEDDARATIQQLANQRAIEGEKAYAEAFAQAAPFDDRIAGLLQNPKVQQALKEGLDAEMTRSAARGVPFNPNQYAVTAFNEAGDPILGEVPNMRTLDAIKRGIDRMIDAAPVDPLTGRMKSQGADLVALKNAIVSEMDRVNPAYKAARQQYSDYSGLMEAVDKGKKFLSGEIDQTVDDIAKLSPPEKAMLRVGAARELRRIVESTNENNDALRKIFGSPEKTQRLRALFDSDEQFAQFKKYLEDEQLAQRTERYLLGGSQTANKQAERGLLGDFTALESAPSASDITKGLWGKAYEAIAGQVPARRAEALSPTLFAKNPADLAAALKQLQGQTTQQIANQQRNRTLEAIAYPTIVNSLFAGERQQK